jgi:hypothetical protein
MKVIQGYFYYKLTSGGNLLGEYAHNQRECLKSSTESADRIIEGYRGDDVSMQLFEGKFLATWNEKRTGAACTRSFLTISRKPDSKNLFLLNWVEVAENDHAKMGKVLFQGEGMLCHDTLIGEYHSVNV